MGYHGTSAAEAQKITQTNLDPKFMRPGFHGEGFYTTPHSSKALNFTKPPPFNPFGSDPNGMLAVYVKDPATKIESRHFTFHPGSGGALDELRILPSMYNDVKTLQFSPSSNTATPDVKKIFNIRSEIRGTSQRS